MVKKNTAEYEIDSRAVYNISDGFYKDTDLYPYDKQHKSRGAFYTIHSMWLGLNHMNKSASDAEAALQTLT